MKNFQFVVSGGNPEVNVAIVIQAVAYYFAEQEFAVLMAITTGLRLVSVNEVE